MHTLFTKKDKGDIILKERVLLKYNKRILMFSNMSSTNSHSCHIAAADQFYGSCNPCSVSAYTVFTEEA